MNTQLLKMIDRYKSRITCIQKLTQNIREVRQILNNVHLCVCWDKLVLSNQGLHQFNVAPSDGSMKKVLPILKERAVKTNHRNHTHIPVDA